MSSRYFAPGGVDDLLKLKLAGFPLHRAHVSIPILDKDWIWDTWPTDYRIPYTEGSVASWRVRLGYLTYELDPAKSLSLGKAGNAMTDGDLTTFVSFVLDAVPGAWTNLGPEINVGEIGNYLYLVKTGWTYSTTLSRPNVYMRVVAQPGNEILTLPNLNLINETDSTLDPIVPIGALFRGRQSFQLQALCVRPSTTVSPATIKVYEIGIYKA
jgi:hypothetical protein